MSARFSRIDLPGPAGSRPRSAPVVGGRGAAQAGAIRPDATGAARTGGSELRAKRAIIVGSEGHGVSERLRAKATEVRIPTVGVESLNAALAAGIALYAARKQRMMTS